ASAPSARSARAASGAVGSPGEQATHAADEPAGRSGGGRAHERTEPIAKRAEIRHALDLATDAEGHAPRLLGHRHRDRVRLLADPERGTVPCAQRTRDLKISGE